MPEQLFEDIAHLNNAKITLLTLKRKSDTLHAQKLLLSLVPIHIFKNTSRKWRCLGKQIRVIIDKKLTYYLKTYICVF